MAIIILYKFNLSLLCHYRVSPAVMCEIFMPLVTTAVGYSVTHGQMVSTQWPHTRTTDTHTHTSVSGLTGHETHQLRLSTSRHSNFTIKERPRGHPPTSKWCVSALTSVSTLSLPCHHFSLPSPPHTPDCLLPLQPCAVCFYSSLTDSQWPHSVLDYEGGEKYDESLRGEAFEWNEAQRLLVTSAQY